METNGRRSGPIIAIIVAAIVTVGLILFALANRSSEPAGSNPTSNNSSKPSSNTTDTVPAPGDRMTIRYTDAGFEPKELSVKKGTVVTINNDSSEKVQFSSDDHPTHRKNPEMNLGLLAPGESGSYTATQVGTWGFHDHVHADKTGTVTVTE